MYRVVFINILFSFSLLALEILATVNGKAITREDADRFLAKTFPSAKYSSLNERQREEVLNKLIDRELYLEMQERRWGR